jgi:hypothetical protein
MVLRGWLNVQTGEQRLAEFNKGFKALLSVVFIVSILLSLKNKKNRQIFCYGRISGSDADRAYSWFSARQYFN